MGPTEAFRDGVRRGTLMALNPRAAFERERERTAVRPDTVTQAWKSVGQSLRAAMDRRQAEPRR